ncbi:MAG: PAS domain-containing protein [Pseudomonadota bacterium]
MSLTGAVGAPGNQPLLAGSAALFEMTGYPPAALIGKDLRFLQGAESQPAAIAELVRMIELKSGGDVMLINYRASGERWDNYMTLFPVLSAQEMTSHYIGAHFDVPEDGAVEALAQHYETLHDILTTLESARGATAAWRVPLTPLDGLFDQPGRLIDKAARRLLLARLRSVSVGGLREQRRAADVKQDRSTARGFDFSAR